MLSNGSRAGFFIRNGRGVGKGRTISGIIFERYLLGRKKAIWVSDSNILMGNAERDLRYIEAGDIPVQALKKMGYHKILGDGIILSSYACWIGSANPKMSRNLG